MNTDYSEDFKAAIAPVVKGYYSNPKSFLGWGYAPYARGVSTTHLHGRTIHTLYLAGSVVAKSRYLATVGKDGGWTLRAYLDGVEPTEIAPLRKGRGLASLRQAWKAAAALGANRIVCNLP